MKKVIKSLRLLLMGNLIVLVSTLYIAFIAVIGITVYFMRELEEIWYGD